MKNQQHVNRLFAFGYHLKMPIRQEVQEVQLVDHLDPYFVAWRVEEQEHHSGEMVAVVVGHLNLVMEEVVVHLC
jgi:hypothetical protein